MESISDKYTAIEEMTRGTQEWRDAVKEVNDEVLSLIEEYPKLAALVAYENGVLVLNLKSPEVQEILNQYDKQAAAAQNVSLVSDINTLKQEVAVKAAKALEDELGTITYRKTAADIEALARAIYSGEVQVIDGKANADEIATWLQTSGSSYYSSSFAQYLSEYTDELMEIGNKSYEAGEQEKIYKEQMAQNAMGIVDATKYSEEQLR